MSTVTVDDRLLLFSGTTRAVLRPMVLRELRRAERGRDACLRHSVECNDIAARAAMLLRLAGELAR